MGVIVRPLNALGGTPTSLFFSDNFNRSSFGSNGSWLSGASCSIPVVTPLIGFSVEIVANRLRFQNQPAANNDNTRWRGFAAPTPCYKGLYNSGNQFVQFTFQGDTPVSVSEFTIGPAIFLTGYSGNLNAYVALCEPFAGLLRILRFTGTSAAVIGTYTTPAGVAAGDVIRLSGVDQGSQVNFTLSKNGVPASFVDNTGGRFAVGSPGIFVNGLNGGITDGIAECDDFSCGPGA